MCIDDEGKKCLIKIKNPQNVKVKALDDLKKSSDITKSVEHKEGLDFTLWKNACMPIIRSKKLPYCIEKEKEKENVKSI